MKREKLLKRNQQTRAIIRFYPECESEGLSFTVKDNISIKGYPVSAGLAVPPIPCASGTSPVVDKLLKNECALVGACNLDLFAIGASGLNPFWGDMKHLGKESLQVLGSSGGSAISVAMNGVDFSLVTDVAGSARLPAIYPELIGMRFRRSSVSMEGVLQLQPKLDSLGVITSEVKTLKRIVKIVCKNDKNDYSLSEEEIPEKLVELYPEIQGIHKMLMALGVSKTTWLNDKMMTDELAALKELSRILENKKVNNRHLALKEEINSLVKPGTVIRTSIPKKQEKFDKFMNKKRAVFLISNICDWPALLIGGESGKSIHLTGPVSERELLEVIKS